MFVTHHHTTERGTQVMLWDRRTTAEKFEDMWVSTSFHEAGHATAAVLHGIPVREAGIRVTKGLLSDPAPQHSATRAGSITGGADPYDFLINVLAGGTAEAMLYEQWGWGRWRINRETRTSMSGDRELVHAEYRDNDLELTGALWRHAERDTRALMWDAWDQVCDVAEALRDADGYLPGADIQAVVWA